MARDMECADDIDGHHCLPLVGVGVLDGSRRSRDAGVVYQNIEPAKRIDGGGNHAFDVVTL